MFVGYVFFCSIFWGGGGGAMCPNNFWDVGYDGYFFNSYRSNGITASIVDFLSWMWSVFMYVDEYELHIGVSYCWWKKSLTTTWDVYNSIMGYLPYHCRSSSINRSVLNLFDPSAISIMLMFPSFAAQSLLGMCPIRSLSPPREAEWQVSGEFLVDLNGEVDVKPVELHLLFCWFRCFPPMFSDQDMQE